MRATGLRAWLRVFLGVVTATGLLAGFVGPAGADVSPSSVNPAGTTIPSTGQSLDIGITGPIDGSTVAAGDPVNVTGQVGIGGLVTSANVLYVVDFSGSTERPPGQDCDGSGAGDAGDDFNGDGTVGDTLDCEISGVLALNSSLAALTGVDGGVVPFGSSAAVADVGPAAGQQDFTTPLDVDVDTSGTGDIEEVMRSLDQGNVGQFTPYSVNTGTDFNDALASMNSAFAGQPAGEDNVAFFLSDGDTNPGTFSTGVGSPLQAAVDAGTLVNTYSVGADGTGCGLGADLRTIADSTGGTCTEVTNPADLAGVLGGATPAGIDRVEIQIDGGTPIPAVVDALGNFSATIAGTAITGPTHTIAATVFADDPDATSVTADVTINAIGAGESFSIDVKPGSCPNPLQVNGRGVVPVAVVGTDAVDVEDIDPATVRLSGVAPLRWSIEDVATPFELPDDEVGRLDCSTATADGIDDLTLKFDKTEILEALGPVQAGDVIVVEVTGQLFDGTSFGGEDVIWIVGLQTALGPPIRATLAAHDSTTDPGLQQLLEVAATEIFRGAVTSGSPVGHLSVAMGNLAEVWRSPVAVAPTKQHSQRAALELLRLYTFLTSET